MIPYGLHYIDNKDIKAVIKTLKSNFLTQGTKILEFENSLSRKFDSKFSIAVNSATSALHISCLALGLKRGDYLWTSAISFVASSNCALYCGAKIDFLDVNKYTNNIDLEYLKKKLKFAKKRNKLPKIIALVHLAGYPCDLDEIKKLSKKYKFKIIEDASHASGSVFKGSKIGSSKYSDITIFSFHPVKIFTTAEGGATLTNNRAIYNLLKLYRNHGIEKNISNISRKKHGLWHYEQKYLGYNYRMNEIQATLGIEQLKKMDYFVNKRNKIANIYNQKFKNFNIYIPPTNKKIKSAYHLYIIKLKNKTSKEHKRIFKKLRNKKINVNLHYIPIYKHPYYRKLNFKSKNFPVAEKYHSSAISLPIYPSLKTSDQKYVIQILKEILN